MSIIARAEHCPTCNETHFPAQLDVGELCQRCALDARRAAASAQATETASQVQVAPEETGDLTDPDPARPYVPEQFTERQMYAEIALADLPTPTTVSMHHGILAMDFMSIADGQAWASERGADCAPFADRRGRRYLGARFTDWHGWRVQINASEDGAPDGGLDGGEPR